MKYLFPSLAAAFLVLPLFSCNQSRKQLEDLKQSQLSSAEALTEKYGTSDSTFDNNAGRDQFPERRFIRKASMKFKVREVPPSVQFIENKTRLLGGFVTYSTITNTIGDSVGFPISKDSLMQTIHYTTQGFLTLRVPDRKLDTLLELIQPISVFLVNREIRADDQGLQWFANQLAQQRAEEIKKRSAGEILRYSKKPEVQLTIEKWKDEQAASADQAKLNNLLIEDEVSYSTISLSIYQDPSLTISKFMKPPVTYEFGPSFFDQLAQSFNDGWSFLKMLVINLTRIWSLLLIAFAGLFIFNRYMVPRKKPKIS